MTPFPNIRFNNISAINRIIPPPCLFSVLIIPFPKITPNDEEVTGVINKVRNPPFCLFLIHFLPFQHHHQSIDLNFLVILRF